jgi:hypothetical protein
MRLSRMEHLLRIHDSEDAECAQLRKAQVIDAPLRQQVASPTWNNADHCAVNLMITISAPDAGRNCRRFPRGHMGRHERPFLFPSRVTPPLRATVDEFSRAYEAASPDEKAALRLWMRKIVMPNKARRTDLAKSRSNEKESVEAPVTVDSLDYSSCALLPTLGQPPTPHAAAASFRAWV